MAREPVTGAAPAGTGTAGVPAAPGPGVRRRAGRGFRPHRGGHEEGPGRLPRPRPEGRARGGSPRSGRPRSDLDVETAGRAVRGQRAQLKGVLTDQRVIAGIGNAYSDEILHAARLSPFKIAARLTDAEVEQSARGDRRRAHRRRDPLGRAEGGHAQGREAQRPARPRPHRPALPGLWGHGPRGLLRRQVASSTARLARPTDASWRTVGCPSCSSSSSPETRAKAG